MFEILHEETFEAEAQEVKRIIEERTPKNGWGIKSLEGKTLNVMLCGKETSKALNMSQRGLDKPTDVLSWAYTDCVEVDGEDDGLAGELAVCIPICIKQASENGWDFEIEFARLLVHGLAHILGYDHETADEEEKMMRFEVAFLEKMGIAGLYSLSEP